METKDLEILLKITKTAKLDDKQRKANRKRKRRMKVQWADEGPMDQELHYEENFIWSVREPAG